MKIWKDKHQHTVKKTYSNYNDRNKQKTRHKETGKTQFTLGHQKKIKTTLKVKKITQKIFKNNKRDINHLGKNSKKEKQQEKRKQEK